MHLLAGNLCATGMCSDLFATGMCSNLSATEMCSDTLNREGAQAGGSFSSVGCPSQDVESGLWVAPAQAVPDQAGVSYGAGARQLIAPVALVGLGAIGSQISDFKELDFGLRKHTRHSRSFVFEDALQYAPLGAMYLLKMGGVKSAHSYGETTALAAGSFCITAGAVYLLKGAVDELRPNGKDSDSFPSGHSAIAFMGAELLRREFRDTSPVIGYAGYATATAVSLLRLRHCEHWLPDLLAGAGIGILGTHLAYWATPYVAGKFFGKWTGLPFYDGKVRGLSLAFVF